MIGSVIVRTLVATFLTLAVVSAIVFDRIDAGTLGSSALGAVLWWTLLTDWTEARR